jgi:hypothetical protein
VRIGPYLVAEIREHIRPWMEGQGFILAAQLGSDLGVLAPEGN